jgi:peptidoglycan hydrolase CwlO-like protein
MDSIESLACLEEVVEKMLATLKGMKQEKLVLEARVESRDQEIATFKEQLASLQGERGQIQQRITGLISSIEQWEKLNESKTAAEPSGPVIEEKTLF